MGKSQRDKGYRFENEIRKFLVEKGREAVRVPLSGGDNNFKGDVILKNYFPEPPYDLVIECKKRANGFKQIYDWLEGNDALILGADRKEPLIVLRLKDWV